MMALKFRLKGLAETFIDEITCPECGVHGDDDTYFVTEFTRVTYEGIVVVAECKSCGEIFVPGLQRLGVLDPPALRDAVERDHLETGEPLYKGFKDIRLVAERLNAQKKGEII
jgi:hypothetical protein